MKMTLEINPTEKLISDRGLEPGGRVQKFIDKECIELMTKYTPWLNGVLEKAPESGTVIGSGIIKQTTPYARFQYYGKVMIDPETESTFAPLYGKKVLTDRDLEYNLARHQLAGSHWFSRMAADYKDEILRGAQELAGR